MSVGKKVLRKGKRFVEKPAEPKEIKVKETKAEVKPKPKPKAKKKSEDK